MERMKERPVFLVSPLPASGMTHIQRTITAHRAAHILGEWSSGGVAMSSLARLYGMTQEFQTRYTDRIEGLRAALAAGKEVANEWIAEMGPKMEDIDHAVRYFVRSSCKAAPIWGFCSTHTAQHIPLLMNLFPDSFAIVAIRQPRWAVGAWTGYSGSDVLSRAMIAQARQAYATLIEADRNSHGRILWVDWREQEDPKMYLDKLYKTLELEQTPFAREVAKTRIEKHFHDPTPVVPEWLKDEAEGRLKAVYSIGKSIAEAQMPALVH